MDGGGLGDTSTYKLESLLGTPRIFVYWLTPAHHEIIIISQASLFDLLHKRLLSVLLSVGTPPLSSSNGSRRQQKSINLFLFKLISRYYMNRIHCSYSFLHKWQLLGNLQTGNKTDNANKLVDYIIPALCHVCPYRHCPKRGEQHHNELQDEEFKLDLVCLHT